MRTLPANAVTTRPAQFPGPRRAKVTRVVGIRLFVELDSSPGIEVEVTWARPHPPHTHTHPDTGQGAAGTGTTAQPVFTAPNPPKGTRCLVLFTDQGVADGWVVGWAGWPA